MDSRERRNKVSHREIEGRKAVEEKTECARSGKREDGRRNK